MKLSLNPGHPISHITPIMQEASGTSNSSDEAHYRVPKVMNKNRIELWSYLSMHTSLSSQW